MLNNDDIRKDKSTKFSFRIDNNLKDELIKEATERNNNISEYLRNIIIQRSQEYLVNSQMLSEQRDVSKKLIFLYNKSSNNINQIAKSLNKALLTGKLSDELFFDLLSQLKLVNSYMSNIAGHLDVNSN